MYDIEKKVVQLMGRGFNLNSEFYCTQCGQKGIPISRKRGQERELGHLKKIYCLHCKIQTNHAETRPFTKYDFETFKLEYEYGNFNEQGKRIRELGKLKELINNGQIEKQKTLADVWDPRLGKKPLDT